MIVKNKVLDFCTNAGSFEKLADEVVAFCNMHNKNNFEGTLLGSCGKRIAQIVYDNQSICIKPYNETITGYYKVF